MQSRDTAAPHSWGRYVAVGDSFTEGLADELDARGRHRGWADRVANALAEHNPDLRYANLAVRGRLVGEVAREQVPAAIALEPDLVSFAAGVNDALRRDFDLRAAATAVEQSIRALRATGCDVLVFAFGDPARRSSLMGVVRDRLKRYDSAVRAIAEHYGCYLVDFWDVAAFDEDRFWDDDRLHLSPSGHALAAACALDALGVGDDSWRTPRPRSYVSTAQRAVSHARWAGAYLSPWVVRRIQGRSSGDGIEPKYPDLTRWPAIDAQ
jgi:lysophospholipase L1-like esterase